MTETLADVSMRVNPEDIAHLTDAQRANLRAAIERETPAFEVDAASLYPTDTERRKAREIMLAMKLRAKMFPRMLRKIA